MFFLFFKGVSSVNEFRTEHSPRICTSFRSAVKFAEVRKLAYAMWKKMQVEFLAVKEKKKVKMLTLCIECLLNMRRTNYASKYGTRQQDVLTAAYNSSLSVFFLVAKMAIVPKLTQLGGIVLCQQPITACA